MRIHVEAGPAKSLEGTVREGLARLAPDEERAVARARFTPEEVTLELWLWNERFQARAALVPDARAALAGALAELERSLRAARAAGLRGELDVQGFVARSRPLVDGPQAPGAAAPLLRFCYRLPRAEALGRLRLASAPFLMFLDEESGRNAVLFSLSTPAEAPFFLVLEDADEMAGFDQRATFGLRCLELDGAARARGERLFELPIVALPATGAELARSLRALGAPVALGRKPGTGTPFLAVTHGGRTWLHDYAHDNAEVLQERFEGFPPPELCGAPADWRAALACPACHAPIDGSPGAAGAGRGAALACGACGARYPVVDGIPHFLSGAETPRPVAQGEEWVMNPLPKVLPYFLRKHARGLVLDCGSGNTPLAAPNLVNLEVFRFPNTTVVASGGRLPFRDACFDAVLSAAVLEHVPDPFAYCREILRVLKPGGELRIDSAFLQPYHACPDHYFGTTHSGLAAATAGFATVARGVDESQSPLVALQAMLFVYSRALADEAHRRRFLDSRVGDLLALPPGQGPSFLRLPRERAGDLAAGVYLHALKPRE